MGSNLRIKIIENRLLFTLNQWLHSNPENTILIEMDYIEKTVKRLYDAESIDETNEI
jgi:hypothetical protein